MEKRTFWNKFETFDREINVNSNKIFYQVIKIIRTHNILKAFRYVAMLISNNPLQSWRDIVLASSVRRIFVHPHLRTTDQI